MVSLARYCRPCVDGHPGGHGILAAQPRVRLDPECRAHCGGGTMTEVYQDSPVSDVPWVTARLCESGCRLVATFAEDRTEPEGRYYIYYVFEQANEPRYRLVRTPVAADNPVFPSLAAG